MKYLEAFKYFENVSVINSYIQDVNDILQELYDYNWIININYIPKRFENPGANHIIKSDYIGVVIKKKQNKSRSRYPDNSEFKFSEVSEYIYRIIDYFMTDDYRVRISESVGETGVYQGVTGYHKNTGIWSDWMESEIPEDKKILGVEINIYLQGDNLDNFKYKFR
jgi:hypothetical protein